MKFPDKSLLPYPLKCNKILFLKTVFINIAIIYKEKTSTIAKPFQPFINVLNFLIEIMISSLNDF